MKRVMSALGLAAILSLLAVGTVLAWPDDTTAALSSTPTGLSAGQSWTVDVTFVSAGHVLRVDTLQPRITIRETTTGETRSFPATVTATSGVYRAKVAFPSGGSWAYSVDTPYRSFAYSPITIAPAPSPAPTPGSPAGTFLAVIAVAAGVATLVLLAARRFGQRRRVARPAPSQ